MDSCFRLVGGKFEVLATPFLSLGCFFYQGALSLPRDHVNEIFNVKKNSGNGAKLMQLGKCVSQQNSCGWQLSANANLYSVFPGGGLLISVI